MTTTTLHRPAAATAVAALSFAGALGAASLCLGHTGLSVPVLSAFGPGGSGAVPVAAAIFAVGAVLYAVAGVAALQRTTGAWTAGLVVHSLAVLSGLGNFRGVVSAVGIVVSLAALAVLLSPQGRQALRGR